MNHLTGDDYTGFIIKVNDYYKIIQSTTPTLRDRCLKDSKLTFKDLHSLETVRFPFGQLTVACCPDIISNVRQMFEEINLQT